MLLRSNFLKTRNLSFQELHFQFSLWRGKVWVQHSCGDTAFWCVVTSQTRWSSCTYSKIQRTAKANKDVKDKYQESFRDYLSAADSVKSWKSQPYYPKEPWMSFDEPAYPAETSWTYFPLADSASFTPPPALSLQHAERYGQGRWANPRGELPWQPLWALPQISHVFLYDRAQRQVPSLHHVLWYGDGLLILMQPEPTQGKSFSFTADSPCLSHWWGGRGQTQV